VTSTVPNSPQPSAQAARLLPAFLDPPARATGFIALIFIILSAVFVFGGLPPRHDAIGWFAGYHYFYDSIAHGVIPFWNPYSQAGTPFYPYFQALGLWEPSNYLFVLFQKITGCSTLTTYLCHYFFYYFLFIAGTYHALRLVTGRGDVSLVFALVLFLGVFPDFMVQNGALNSFYWLPFLAYSLFKFFQERSTDLKGIHLFAASILCASACLVYIPAGLVFFLFFFIPASFIFGAADFRDLREFLRRRRAWLWIGASALCSALIAAPVLALDQDINAGKELFPFNRVLLAFHFHLPKIYSAVLQGSLFDRNAVLPVSITLGNLLGMFFEPFRFKIPNFQYSEIILYLGVVPLFCMLAYLARPASFQNRRGLIMLTLAAASLLLMTNFAPLIAAPESLFQRILCAVVPTLGKIEVYENFGALFLFCGTCLATIAFNNFLAREEILATLAALTLWSFLIKSLFFPVWINRHAPFVSRLETWTGLPGWGIAAAYASILGFLVLRALSMTRGAGSARDDSWGAPLFQALYMTLYAYAVGLPLLVALLLISRSLNSSGLLGSYRTEILFFLKGQGFVLGQIRHLIFALSAVAAVLMISIGFQRASVKSLSNLAMKKLPIFICFLVFLDLAIFNIALLASAHKTSIRSDFSVLLKGEAPTRSKPLEKSLSYRSVRTEGSYKYTFFGREIIRQTKAAFPASWASFSNGDQIVDAIFSTSLYYDYLTRVDIDHQYSASGVTKSILDFYPSHAGVPVASSYEAIRGLNQTSLAEEGGKLFIERSLRPRLAPPPPEESPEFLGPGFYPRKDREELRIKKSLRKPSFRRAPPAPGFLATPLFSDPNTLVANVMVPEDGYLYFSDGYSRHWKAFLDGRPVPIYIANAAFKAIEASKGRHHVEFLYDPAWIRRSMGASLAGTLLSAFVALFYLLRLRRPADADLAPVPAP
jgi:hypothetical protein